MILQDPKREVKIEGIESAVKMHISESVTSHVIKVLTEYSYQDSLGSGIRECISNAIDSHTEAGQEEPVIVSLKNDSIGNYILEVEDKGVGLDKESFEKYIMGIGQSTKRNDDKFLGGFGAGAKAWLSYTDSFFYTCVKDNVERKFMIFKGESFPESTMLYEKSVDKPNGVKVTVPIKNNDRFNVINKIKEQCSYFENIYFDINGFKNTYKIYKSEDFVYNEINPSDELHICLKGVQYPIDWKKLGISPIYVPIALRFDDYSEIKPIFNRESIEWTSKAIDAVKRKIKKVAKYFVKKYNDQTKELETFKEYFDLQKNDKKVLLHEDCDLYINIEEFGEPYLKLLKDNTVKGVKFNSLELYKRNLDNLFSDYNIIASLDWKKRISSNFFFKTSYITDRKILLIDAPFTGYFKEYIRENVKCDFIAKKREKEDRRKDLNYYIQILNLDWKEKHLWRDKIKEYIEVKERLPKEISIDGTKLHLSKEFLEYKKEKSSKKKNESNYEKLNKQKGDITLQFPEFYENNNNKVKLKKQVFNLEQLNNIKYKLYVFEEEDAEICKDLYQVSLTLPRYKFCIAGKREIKKLPETKNIIMIPKLGKEKLSNEKCFKKIATAILFKSEIEKFERIRENSIDILKSYFYELEESYSELNKYVNKNYRELNIANKEDSFLSQLLAKIKEENNFDLTLFDHYHKIKEANEKLSFLIFFQRPYGWHLSRKDYFKFINEMLILKKLSNKLDIKGLKIVKEEVEEQKENLEVSI